MMDLARLFSTDGFMPHGMCYLWRPGILAIHVGADSLIALAYFTIPVTLVYFVRRRSDMRFTWILLCFAVFIVACGASHVMEIWTIWFPVYWLSGGIKMITALVSVTTAILLVKLVPTALQFPTPSALLAANENLAREILERKRAEQTVLEINASLEARVAERTAQLAEANETLTRINGRFAIASEAAGLGFWDFDIASNTLRWDEQMFVLYGRTRSIGEQPYTLWSESLHPEDRKGSEQQLIEAINGTREFQTEFRIIQPDGDIRHMKASARVTRDGEGNPLQMVGVNIDITERKRAENALRAGEQRYRFLAETMPQIIWTAKSDGHLDYLNQQAYDYTGLEFEQFKQWGWKLALHPDDLHDALERWTRSLTTGSNYEVEFRLKRAVDNTYRWHLARAFPLHDRRGAIIQWVGTCTDIDDRKRAEATLKDAHATLERRVHERTSELAATLREREIMLQEINHRVKNNLQVISSLINMQEREVKDGAVRSALQECRARIQTIALIHEKLYQSADYSSVPFSEYARNLATNIVHVAGVSPTAIALHLDIEPLSLAVDKAIPCGLLLNELITNALKHAFPNARGGTVRVELRRAGDREAVLAVGDDGIGLPAQFDLAQSSSFGVQLVTTLVEQLGGRLEITRSGGTTFSVTFPVEAQTQRAGLSALDVG